MEVMEELAEDGWKLSPEGYNLLTDEGKITNKHLIEKKGIDIDLRELGGCAFPQDLNKGKYESVTGNMVVQIQKTRNISAPKANEESKHAPRMLKLILNDGSQSCPALELSPIDNISSNTPPGTKIRLKGEMDFCNGLLLLNNENVEVLGGNVLALVEKWLTNKNLAKQARGRVGAEGGPPPWIPFGEKLSPTHIADRNFKSLDEAAKETKDNEEFEAQRRDAIAEARAAGCTKKIFGGGTKPLLDRNIQAIMSKGFTIQEAEAALKQNRNNVDKALKNLQRKSGKGPDEKEKTEKEPGRERGGRRKGGDEETGPKPSGRVILFQFVEDKLPSLPEKDKTKEKEKEKEWEPPKQEQSKAKGYPGQEKSRPRERGPQHQSNIVGNGVEKKNREDRQPRWQNQNQNQKPPRFQNQNKRLEFNNDPFDHFVSRTDAPHNNRQAENYFGNKNNPPQYNGFRNNYKIDSLGYNMNSGNDFRNQNSNFFKPAGMPDIPEFPYKDSAFIPPLIPSTMHSMNGNKNTPVHNPPIQKIENSAKYRWKVGDKCMAKYWEDNVYYNAEVTGISKKTCVVRFLEYGNFEEVLQDDCIPISEEPLENINLQNSEHHGYSNNRNSHFSGSIEFRRGGTRPYIKADANNGTRKPRYSQPMYVPPASRRETK